MGGMPRQSEIMLQAVHPQTAACKGASDFHESQRNLPQDGEKQKG